MRPGSRCGCRALTELDEERSRHAATVQDNVRYANKIQDLHEELESLHDTVADLERRYSELSSRYRKSLQSLDEVNDTNDRLKDHSTDVSESNRRMKNNYEKLQNELNVLRKELCTGKDIAEDERRKRIAAELCLTRDIEEVDRNRQAQLRRAASVHELDSQHLKKDITKLQSALEREKFRHSLTKQSLHHVSLHMPSPNPFSCFHDSGIHNGAGCQCHYLP